ncbi:glycosyltransferase [Granulosicoccus sp. 3-233]|uniref:glycosyltransferase n=1 Tax=Granulosicoccus sp. 3-233 TaxID=3417969 RepID=UPI003D324FC2
MNGTSAVYSEGKESEYAISLFQFWDKDIPEAVAELTRGVAQVNAALNYQLFDDVGAAEFIRVEYGSEILKLYRSCVIPAMRADLFRYCFLARCGGIYIDADFPAVSSLEPMVQADWKGCLYRRERGLTNSMMYFRDARNPLAEKFLEEALYNVSNRTSNNVWQVTGPHVLQTVHADERYQDLFDGIHYVDEEEFARYFELARSLDYKSDDKHWLVARQKGLDIFRD